MATLHGPEATSWLVGFFMPHIVRETRSPLVEAWIDRAAGVVERVLPPPPDEPYGGMPVPVF